MAVVGKQRTLRVLSFLNLCLSLISIGVSLQVCLPFDVSSVIPAVYLTGVLRFFQNVTGARVLAAAGITLSIAELLLTLEFAGTRCDEAVIDQSINQSNCALLIIDQMFRVKMSNVIVPLVSASLTNFFHRLFWSTTLTVGCWGMLIKTDRLDWSRVAVSGILLMVSIFSVAWREVVPTTLPQVPASAPAAAKKPSNRYANPGRNICIPTPNTPGRNRRKTIAISNPADRNQVVIPDRNFLQDLGKGYRSEGEPQISTWLAIEIELIESSAQTLNRYGFV